MRVLCIALAQRRCELVLRPDRHLVQVSLHLVLLHGARGRLLHALYVPRCTDFLLLAQRQVDLLFLVSLWTQSLPGAWLDTSGIYFDLSGF